MTAPDNALMALSNAVLHLHQGSREWPAASFAPRACELLQSVIAFDACLWGSTHTDAAARSALALQGMYAQGLDNEALALCQNGGNPGPVASAEQIEPVSRRRVELHLWRLGEQARPFETADQQALQFLMPHLVEAQRENRLSRSYDDDRSQRPLRSHAMCDEQGTLLDLDPQCLALLRVEWPRWVAPHLPEPLREAVAAHRPGTAPFHGRQVTVLMTRSARPDGAVLLDVRRRTAIDRLSERQRGIAELYAAGSTGADIAERLHLAESTVNNHLGVIFKKLAVSSKLQLAEVMRAV